MFVTPHQRKVAAIVSKLLEWYSKNARDLPWRRTTDPYAIWISEIMLQQTQVKTVIPYWQRWMRELPTIEALARARPERVLKLWEGLGYYTRARNLHQAARLIMARRGGKFPERFEDILALPGVGRYTAGAIASIAFNQPKPVLDGNVVRVLTRLFGIATNPREQKTNKKLWRLAEALVVCATELRGRHKTPLCVAADVSRLTLFRKCQSGLTSAATILRGPLKPPRSNNRRSTTRRSPFAAHPAGNCSLLNQALMELGALLCTPRQPQCAACPLRQCCAAFRSGRVDRLPNLGPRPPATPRRFAAFVIEHRGRFLVRRRPAGVVNAHLWEFPNLELNGDCADARQAARRLLRSIPDPLPPLCTVKHTITRYRVTVDAFHVQVPRRPAPGNGTSRWCTLEELHPLAFTSAHRKILEKVAQASLPAG